MLTKWEDYLIKVIDLSDEQITELFSGVSVSTLDETLGELFYLEDGYYEIEGFNQYFEINTVTLTLSEGVKREIKFPLFNENFVCNYIENLAVRKYQEAEGEILTEIILFNNDLDREIVFFGGVAKLKNYYGKSVEVVVFEDGDGYDLHVNGKAVVNIYYNKQYTAYDGVDGYGWCDTIKEAVKRYMDCEYRYQNPFESDDGYSEPNCSNCGDGGCLYCETHRFL